METCTDGVASDQGHNTLGEGGRESLCAGESQGASPGGAWAHGAHGRTGRVGICSCLHSGLLPEEADKAVVGRVCPQDCPEPQEELPFRGCSALPGLGAGHLGAADEGVPGWLPVDAASSHSGPAAFLPQES